MIKESGSEIKLLKEEIIACRKCPRLVAWREEVARERKKAYREQVYWGKPVPGFGDPQARLLVVGLAPGAHGSNRTGRMFTGDASGVFLYAALHREGFANQALVRDREDGLALKGVFITAVCRCAPPDNKPTGEEIANCLPFLTREMDLLKPKGVVALGRIALDGLLGLWASQEYGLPRVEFGHGAFYRLGEGLPWLLASYHPSRQNTQTGRLTVEMFDSIWKKAREEMEEEGERQHLFE
jgi:uracil-DNA glycosylase family 4